MQNTFKKIIKIYSLILLSLSSITFIDTYILHGKLKLLYLCYANTTNPNPFTTDGQSNLLFILIALTLWAIITYYMLGKNTKCLTKYGRKILMHQIEICYKQLDKIEQNTEPGDGKWTRLKMYINGLEYLIDKENNNDRNNN